MGKGFYAANAAVAYFTLFCGDGVVADWSEDVMAEEFPNPPTNLSLNNMGGNSHGGERENNHNVKDNTVCDDENGYGLEEEGGGQVQGGTIGGGQVFIPPWC